MRKHACTTRTLLTTAAAGGLLLTGSGPVAAAPPDTTRGTHLEFDRFEDPADEVWEDGGDCDLGFDVHYVRDARGTFRFTPRGKDGVPYAHVTVHGTETWSANGHTFTHVFNVSDADQVIVDEGKTLLITGHAAGGDRFYVDGTLTLRDPGTIRYQFRVDHAGTPTDPSDDEFLEDLGLVFGSTGLNETEDRTFCENLALFLSP